MGVFFNGKAQFSSQCLVIFKKKKSYFLCLLISLVEWTFTPRFVCQLVRSWLILSLQHLHKAKYSLFGLKYLMKYFYFHLFILFFILPVKSFLSLPQSFSGLCFSFQRLKILEVNTFKTKVKKKTPFFPTGLFLCRGQHCIFGSCTWNRHRPLLAIHIWLLKYIYDYKCVHIQPTYPQSHCAMYVGCSCCIVIWASVLFCMYCG